MGDRAMTHDARAFDAADTVLVIGLGKSGIASIDVLRARGARVYATDEKAPDAIVDAIGESRRLGATFIASNEIAPLVDSLRCAVLSPGVPLTSPVVRTLQRASVAVLSEIEIAYRLCAAPIIAVTGTKGKSTTTSLIAHLLRSAGRTVRVGGNIGNPLIREVVRATPQDYVVAEVSSFQLETIDAFRPRVAVLLNIAPDHLDRYDSMDAYARAKYRIVANQTADDTFIADLDDERIVALRGEDAVRARSLWFTLGEQRKDAAMYLDGDAIVYALRDAGMRAVEIARCDDIPLAGAHNVRNVMAASLSALAIGLEPTDLRAAIRSFRAMPHRLETLAEIEGVRYVDDSKSTNPSSVVAALHAYATPIVLIAGGRSKGSAFSEMGAHIRERAKALVLIGETADEIASQARGVPNARAASMEEAVHYARDFAIPGDVVLLSPGCASFDMFLSAEDRGDAFARAVASLQAASHA